MDVSEKLVRCILNTYSRLRSIGKPPVYIYYVEDARFLVRKNTADCFIVDEIWKQKVYDVPIIKEDAVIVDGGAHIGAFSLWAARRAHRGKVFAFEPVQENYEFLLKNTEGNDADNIVTFRMGLSQEGGERQIFLGDKNTGSGSLYESHTTSTESVETVRLQDIFELCDIHRIDLLKLDLEGAEYEVLLSTPGEALSRVDKIVLEFHDYLGLETTCADLIQYLTSEGFSTAFRTPFISRQLINQGVIFAERCKL